MTRYDCSKIGIPPCLAMRRMLAERMLHDSMMPHDPTNAQTFSFQHVLAMLCARIPCLCIASHMIGGTHGKSFATRDHYISQHNAKHHFTSLPSQFSRYLERASNPSTHAHWGNSWSHLHCVRILFLAACCMHSASQREQISESV